ncbi:MAG: hypothetical protein LBJ83_02040 [Oscillospiraceae bacterium]|nr:hypothetical protein [Oscillospiraceae bacterium]
MDKKIRVKMAICFFLTSVLIFFGAFSSVKAEKLTVTGLPNRIESMGAIRRLDRVAVSVGVDGKVTAFFVSNKTPKDLKTSLSDAFFEWFLSALESPGSDGTQGNNSQQISVDKESIEYQKLAKKFTASSESVLVRIGFKTSAGDWIYHTLRLGADNVSTAEASADNEKMAGAEKTSSESAKIAKEQKKQKTTDMLCELVKKQPKKIGINLNKSGDIIYSSVWETLQRCSGELLSLIKRDAKTKELQFYWEIYGFEVIDPQDFNVNVFRKNTAVEEMMNKNHKGQVYTVIETLTRGSLGLVAKLTVPEGELALSPNVLPSLYTFDPATGTFEKKIQEVTRNNGWISFHTGEGAIFVVTDKEFEKS